MKTKNARWPSRLIIGIIVCLLLAAAPFMWEALVQKYLFFKMGRHIYSLSHPQGSVWLHSASGSGPTGGSKEGSILIVGELRSFNGTRGELEDFYGQQDVALRFIEPHGEITLATCCLRYGMPFGFYTEDSNGLVLGPKWGFDPPVSEALVYLIYVTEFREWGFIIGGD